jgi:2,4-dienoyl-CoA reductase-like NADH-dependent reductase (Old Yellow Enzyme family)
MYQTPFADRIRNELASPPSRWAPSARPTTSNSIIAAGRADLCAVARPHLANPAWTLHEAAKLTAKGQPAFNDMAQAHEAWIVDAFAGLERARHSNPARLLGKVKQQTIFRRRHEALHRRGQPHARPVRRPRALPGEHFAWSATRTASAPSR